MNGMKTIIVIDTKSKASKCDQEHLEDKNDADNEHKEPIFCDATKNIDLIMNLARVDEVEDLHHDKRIEDKGEVPGIVVCRLQNCLIVRVSIDKYVSPRSRHPCISVLVLPLKTSSSIEVISIFWDYLLPCEHQHDQQNHLEQGLPQDVLEHCLGNYVVITLVRFPVQEGLVGWLRG